MEEPRHKFFRGSVGVVFVLVIAIILGVLYIYYFKTDSSKNIDDNYNSAEQNSDNTDTGNYNTTEPSDSDNTSTQGNTPTQPNNSDKNSPADSNSFDASLPDNSDNVSTYDDVQSSNFDERN